jgi:hypothetical protein
MLTDSSWQIATAQFLELNVIKISTKIFFVDQQLVLTGNKLIIDDIKRDGNCF